MVKGISPTIHQVADSILVHHTTLHCTVMVLTVKVAALLQMAHLATTITPQVAGIVPRLSLTRLAWEAEVQVDIQCKARAILEALDQVVKEVVDMGQAAVVEEVPMGAARTETMAAMQMACMDARLGRRSAGAAGGRSAPGGRSARCTRCTRFRLFACLRVDQAVQVLLRRLRR